MILLSYLVKVIICSGILYGYYLAALRNKRFHQWNRYYLLLLPVISLLIPLLKIPLSISEDNESIVYAYTYRAVEIREHIESNSVPFTLPDFLTVAYSLVAFLLLVKLILICIRILRLTRTNPSETVNDYTLVALEKPGSPFSFLSYIFWSKTMPLHDEQGNQMLRHEIVHVKQKHTLDKLYLRTVCSIGWINPFFHLCARELSLIHEFIADKQAAGKEIAGYATTILQSAFHSRQFSITNDFFYPPIKRRILMLTNFHNDRFSYLRRIMVLPVSGLIFCSFAFAASGNPHAIPVAEAVMEPAALPVDTVREIFTQVEVQPEYPGGETALNKYLANNIKYPKEAVKAKVSGLVIVKFIIDPTGKITEITTSSKQPKHGAGLEEEAIRVVKGMPDWKPGVQNGHPVNVEFQLPIRFALPSDSPKSEAPQQETPKGKQVYTFVDTPPSFTGGEEALNEYLRSNIKYPADAVKNKVSGTVFVQFTVEADGKISTIRTVGPEKGHGLEEEAIRVVKAMPTWIPGEHENKKVPVQFNLPIRFTLDAKPADKAAGNNANLWLKPFGHPGSLTTPNEKDC
ncbi:outer membrane transport energization protein TonB [Chitinophaga jiangningensis]|uniref:Outer membrane transport energization protein TonB n=1 Tax=Chitinophaga jiangningensis TaxID=1419482 RepID=A0A1M7MF68_9BACT|nr:M56 family metallopeptidase [Chitinophaga jiangningensis]SHM89017.1 outer membrane transport energization protein TonB [Chitinophaga jiangningensis]